MFVDRSREERLLPDARRSDSIYSRVPHRFSRARIGLFRKWRTDSVPSKKVMAREPTERAAEVLSIVRREGGYTARQARAGTSFASGRNAGPGET